MIRIAFVITELEPGGAERCLVELATRIDRSKFEPVVYSLAAAPAAERSGLVQRLAEAEIPTHFLGLKRAWNYFGGVRRLASELRAQRPEIVQTFLFHANVLGARAARLAGIRHVFAGLRVADPRVWRTRVERWATGSAERLVCVSQSVAQFYRRRGFTADRLVVIPNGIGVAAWRDVSPMDLTLLGIPRGRRAIVFVGRLDEQKGLEPFFKELPTIFRNLPQHNLLLLGDGPLRSRLHATAARLNILDRVHFAGWQAEIPPILSACDLLVLPSKWEGMPNVVLEAMTAAKPVVASAADGVTELLGSAAAEQSVPVGNFSQLGRRLVEIVTNPVLSKDLGLKNQARATTEFSVDSMVGRYEQLYLSLAGK